MREHRRALTLTAALGLAAILVIASPAAADRYEPSDAGHPLRAVITTQSAGGMALSAGQTVFATVKATAILLV